MFDDPGNDRLDDKLPDSREVEIVQMGPKTKKTRSEIFLGDGEDIGKEENHVI